MDREPKVGDDERRRVHANVGERSVGSPCSEEEAKSGPLKCRMPSVFEEDVIPWK